MAKDVIYGIVKVPSADITNNPRVAAGTPMECFESVRSARAYMSQVLNDAQSSHDFSWALINPKTPDQPIGVTQSYVMFAINVSDSVTDYTKSHHTASMENVPGYVGYLPHNPSRHFHQGTMIGKDSVAPTVYIPASSKTDKAKPGDEISQRQLACRHKQSKLEVEMSRKEAKERKHVHSAPSEETRNGQGLISYWCEQLHQEGLHQYVGQLQAEFNKQFLGGRAYETDGSLSAYAAIRTVFERISRDAVADDNFELATNARNIAKMANDVIEDAAADKRLEEENMDNRGYFTHEEASALVGYDVREDW